ncbi:MAG TPA: hypothetical protein VFO77_16485 [Actinoplanes sp.]|nr:hypothetical protein [Actinoplanes sp.]
MTRRPITRQDHAAFCATEKWTVVTNARRRQTGHHETYELRLPDGRILRTRISRPVNRDTYGPSMAAHILRDQLDVTAEEFWRWVHDGVPPPRGAPAPPAAALPLELVHLLVHRAGVPESEVARMTQDEAVARLRRYWATRGG